MHVHIIPTYVCLCVHVFFMHHTSNVYMLCLVLGDIMNITKNNCLWCLLRLSRFLNSRQYQGGGVAFQLLGAFCNSGKLHLQLESSTTLDNTVWNPCLPIRRPSLIEREMYFSI